MVDRWTHDPQYSHGYLVPLFALFFLWHRRQLCPAWPWQGSPWGLVLVLAGACLHLVGTCFYFGWLEGLSLLPCLFGVCLLLGGRSALRWAWPALAFLVFMLPLPFQVERLLAQPLQRVATLASTFCLEILGFRASAEGNIIWLNDEIRLGVIAACGGLSMLLTFLALAVAFALVVRRPLLDRILLLASAIPIALLANVVRITLTGVLRVQAGSKAAEIFYHDLAGWFMMLLALGLIWLELKVLSWLLVESEAVGSAPVRLS
jgi:exosortase